MKQCNNKSTMFMPIYDISNDFYETSSDLADLFVNIAKKHSPKSGKNTYIDPSTGTGVIFKRLRNSHNTYKH